MFLESPEGFLTFVFGAQNSCFWRVQKVSWHLLLVPKNHVFGEPRRFPDICFWCPTIMFLDCPEGFLTFVVGAQNSRFWRAQKVSWHLFLVPKTHVFGERRRFPDICFWCPKLMFLDSPEGFLFFGAQNSCFWRAQKVSWHLLLVPTTHVFGEPRRFPDIGLCCPKLMFLESPVAWLFFWCSKLMFLESPKGLLTFVFGAQLSYFWRAQKVSWHLFLVPRTHFFGEPRRFPDICFWCPKLMFLESPEGFLTFVFGAQISCFWRAQKVSWHLFLVATTHVFGESRRFPDICCWRPKLTFLESPEGFLTFVFGAQNSCFWTFSKIHVFGEPRRFPDICFWCPELICLESPKGFLTFAFGARNSCFGEPRRLPDICFWCPKLIFWRAQKVSWHLFLVPNSHVFGEPRRFPDICFWCPKLMFLESPEDFLPFVFGAQNSCFGEPRRFPDICFWCPNLMFLESPQGFLTFVFGAQNSCFWIVQKVSFFLVPKTHVFWRAQKVSWHLFLVSKTHVFGEPRRFPDICFWCPKLMFLESPDGLLTFVFGAQNSCFWRAQKVSWHFFGTHNSWFWRAQKVCWHMFLVPKTHIFGEPRRFPDVCFWCPKLIFLESPEGFLTFVFGAQNSCFWRAQKVSWHLFLVSKIHVFGEPRRFPDICCWCPELTFLESPEGFLTFVFGAQNSYFWIVQKISWHLLLVPKTHVFGEPRRFPDKFFLVPKTHVFGESRRCPDIWFWCPKLIFLESPEGFLTFVFGDQNSYFWRAQKVSWHLLLVPKTHVFGEPRRFPDICFCCSKLMFLESPEGCLTFVFGAQNSCFWRAQKVSWHLFLVFKFLIFEEPRRFPDFCCWCPKLIFLESPEGFLTFVFGAQ